MAGVLHVGLEEPLGDVARRYAAFGADPESVDIVSALPNGVADLRRIMERRQYALVVIDTLAALMATLGIDDFNSAAKVLPLMNELAALAHESGSAIVLLHHASKGTGKYRDSTALGGAVDLIVEMLDPEDVGNLTRRNFKTRGRMATDNFTATFADGIYALAATDESLEMRVLDVIRVATAEGRALSKTAVRAAIGGRVAKTDAALRSLVERHVILYDRSAGYSLPMFGPHASNAANEPEW